MNDNLNIAEETKKRYDQMKNSDFGMYTPDLVHFEVYNFDNHNAYDVEISQKGRIKASCNCSDFTLRGRIYGIPCKHIQYVFDNLEWYRSFSKEEFYESVIEKLRHSKKENVV